MDTILWHWDNPLWYVVLAVFIVAVIILLRVAIGVVGLILVALATVVMVILRLNK